MVNLVNPRVKIVVLGDSPIVIEDLHIDNHQYCQIEIEKNLEEEPNQCDIWIANLDKDTGAKLAAAGNQSAPLLVYLTPSGIDELALAYIGELEEAKHRPTRPGHETYLRAESQRLQTRNKYISKNFSQGTKISDIINEMVGIINLPANINIQPTTFEGRTIPGDLPDTPILLQQRFDGPVFPQLRRYCQDYGLYCYILDGKLNISSIYDPQDLTVVTIESHEIFGEPSETTRNDEEYVQQQTFVESTNLDPLAKKKKKRKTKKVKIRLGKNDVFRYTPIEQEEGAGDYTEYTAVDTTIQGIDVESVLKPNINPDTIIRINTETYKDKYWRVRETRIDATNEDFRDWTSTLTCDVYVPGEAGLDVI